MTWHVVRKMAKCEKWTKITSLFWKKIDFFVFLSLARTKVKSTQMLFLFRLQVILFMHSTFTSQCCASVSWKKAFEFDKHSIGIPFFCWNFRFSLFAYRSLDWYHIEIWLYLPDAIYGIKSIFIECVNVSHQFR